MKPAKPFLISLLVFFSAFVFAQTDEYIFHNVSKGISQHSISAIAQDKKGFLWVGTRYGLNKYDGLSFEVFSNINNDSNAQHNGVITSLSVEESGDIWVGTNGIGLSKYSEKTNQFTSFNNDVLKNSNITCLYNSEQYLWIGTEKTGLHIYDKNTKAFEQFTTNQADPFSISSNYVTTINKDNRGNVWIGTWGSGINLFDRQSARFIHYTSDQNSGLTSDIIRSSFVDQNGTVYIGTGAGIKQISFEDNSKYVFKDLLPSTHAFFKELSSVRVISIAEDKLQNLWIGTENEGLYMLNRSTQEVKKFIADPNDPNSIMDNSVWVLFVDNTGIIWAGTFTQGLCKLDVYESKFKNHFTSSGDDHGLSHSSVSSFAEDANGNIWIGTEGGGLNYFDPKTKTFTHFKHNPNNNKSLSNNNIVSLYCDSQDNLWVATWCGGLCLKPSGKSDFERIQHRSNDSNSIAINDVFTLIEDKKGRMWISAYRKGIDVYNPKTHIFKHITDKKSNNDGIISDSKVRTICEDSYGNIWLGTEGSGIDRLRVDDQLNVIEIENYSAGNEVNTGLTSNIITCSLEDSKGKLWFGTEGGGLLWFDVSNNKFVNVLTEDILRNKAIYAVEEDDQYNLWISSNQGLIKYNQNNESFEIFDETDGLQSSEFLKSASLKASNGTLYFGGLKGFNFFNPNDIKLNPNKPEVYIRAFELHNQGNGSSTHFEWIGKSANSREVHLNHKQNDFSIKVSVLNFSQSSKNQIEYKLLNHDQAWLKASASSVITYSNLPPGHYTFMVKGANNDGLWNDEVKTLEISIASPWYQTWWTYAFYSILGFALLLIGRQNVIRQERLRGQLQIEHLELEQEKKIHQLKSRFFTNISHDFRTPLTLILTPLQTLHEEAQSIELKNKLKGMISNGERLLRLINQILDLSRLESGSEKLAATYGDLTTFLRSIAISFTTLADKESINFKIDLPKEPIMTYFDKDKLEKVMVNLLYNAFKFTPKYGEVSLKATKLNDQIEIIVSDTGLGISKEDQPQIFNRFYRVNKVNKNKAGSGIGLALVKELIEIQKGSINLESQEGKGARFTISIPFGIEHLTPAEIIDEKLDYDYGTTLLKSFDLSIEKDLKAEEPPKPKHDEKPILLIVDDNAEIRNMLASQFENHFKILVSDNGKSALETAKQHIPDIVISDVMMPKMDGYEFCKAMYADEKTSHIPVLLLTAKASDESMTEGLESGAIYYLTKPFNQKLLALRIKNILTKQKQFKKLILENKTLRLEPEAIAISDVDELFIQRAIKCIEENMSESTFQVQDLSDALGMSKIQLYRKLKGLIDQSPNEFIRSIRLKRAAQLLKQGQLTIAEITYEVGFNDLPYFRKCFKKQYGFNPSEFSKFASKLD